MKELYRRWQARRYALSVLGSGGADGVTRRGPAFFPIHRLRRELGLPSHPFWGAAPVLEDVARLPHVAHLSGFEESDLAESEDALPVRRDAPTAVDLAAFAPGRGLNTLFLRADHLEKPLTRITFRDVWFGRFGARFSIFRGRQIDPRSTAMPGAPAFRAILAGRVTRLDDLAYCGDQYHPDNPAHFVGDHLARAIVLRDRCGVPSRHIGLPVSNAPVCAALQAGVDPGFLDVPEGRVFHARRLTLLNASLPGFGGHPFHYGNRAVAAVVADAARRIAGRAQGVGPRIYLSRRAMSRRPLTNEDRLVDALSALGFTTLGMEDLDGAAQLAAVAGARTVVAPHGAALMSLVAARPGTRCIELFNPARGTLCFAVTASLFGVDHRPVFGTPLEGEAWRVDIDEVLNAVRD